LRSQTLANAEFILVDDRSDREVWEYLQALPAVDARFVVHRKPESVSRGCQSSRNIGLDAATAECVVFLDSDDLLAPGCLELRHSAMTKDESVDIIVGRQAIMSEDTGLLHWVNVARPYVSDLDRFLHLAGPLDVPWVNGGVSIRRKSLVDKGIRWRPEFHWDDVVFHIECLLAGLQSRWLPPADRPDAFYRHHAGSRYGTVLDTSEGLANSTAMFSWLNHSLDKAGKATAGRSRALAVSFFHACILRTIDSRQFALADKLIGQAVSASVLTTEESARFRRFQTGRKFFSRSARASYYWDRFARRSFLREFFRMDASTYGTCPVPGKTQLELAGAGNRTPYSSGLAPFNSATQ
jgi:glycosyltransferase involved in cell wall biosynthesis